MGRKIILLISDDTPPFAITDLAGIELLAQELEAAVLCGQCDPDAARQEIVRLAFQKLAEPEPPSIEIQRKQRDRRTIKEYRAVMRRKL